MNKTIFIDTETTGLNTDKCGVYQIAAIVDIDGKTEAEINIFSNIFPEDVVEQEVFDLHGQEKMGAISTYQKPFRAHGQLIYELEKFVDRYDPKDKLIAIGYVADFDNRVLRRFFKKNKDDYFGSYFWHPWIDVMGLAMYFYQDQRHLFENFKLGTVAAYAGVQVDGRGLHDALFDVKLTRELYYKLTS